MKVLLIIFAVILALLFIRIKARVIYDGELTIRAAVCGIWFDVIPRKRKPVKLSEWTKEAVLKREAKEKKKAEKKKLADLKKKKKAGAKKAGQESKKAETEDKSGEPSEPKRKRGLGFYMKFVRIGVRVLKKLFRKLRTNFSWDISKLWIKVAGGEPDKIANSYGLISGGVSGALAFLGEKGKVRYSAPQGYDAVYVEADFLGEKFDFALDIKIGTSVGKLLGILNGIIGSAIAGFFREFVLKKDG